MPSRTALSLILAFLIPLAAFSQGRTQVGEEVRVAVRSPRLSGAVEVSGPVWKHTIFHPGASYIAPRFERLDLPPGASLVVRTPDGKRSRTYTGRGKGELGATEGFWGMHMPGDTALLELYAAGPVPEGAVKLGSFAHGYPMDEPEAICGADDSQWAKCSQDTEPQIYGKSRAVGRLLIQGFSACTGWLVGDSGHLLTNNHCITSASDAANTDYELMGEGATCATDCSSFGACPGTVVADTGTLVKFNAGLDYALIQLPVNPTPTYGFLQLRASGPEVGERIYLPGHPGAWGKRISDLSTHPADLSGHCEIQSLSEPPCTGGPDLDVGYFCDTQGGSSGSPVIGYGDHLVVALHHCAYCPNRGASIKEVIEHLDDSLPPNAIGNPCTPLPAPVVTAVPTAGGISLSWNAVPGASEYRVYRSATPGGPYKPVGTTTATSHLDMARCGTTAYYVVRALGDCPSARSAEVSASTGSCPHCAHALLYENGFETGSGLADWAAGSFVGGTSDWRGIQTCSSASGSRIFRFGADACGGQYGPDQFSYVQPQAATGFAIPADAVSTRLSFSHRWEFESSYDGGALMISVDDSSFAPIPASALSGAIYNNDIATYCTPAGADGMAVFSGSQGPFVTTEVDLEQACMDRAGVSCAGRKVRLAFSAATDCSVESTGWFLDDVMVSACVPEVPEPLDFYTLTPCRLVDTRGQNAPLQPGSQRTF
ncbi:MAG TPA: trypsin-like peptidase domain-containing protein, partial [Thermoanaerobaculia bacterium]|nr:trypsin-like peptidase domain-containing protein [Thermoanaerobaculia bacterium]